MLRLEVYSLMRRLRDTAKALPQPGYILQPVITLKKES